jgi:hypothetical protein
MKMILRVSFSYREFLPNKNQISVKSNSARNRTCSQRTKNKYRVCKVGTWKFYVIKTGCILLLKEAKRVKRKEERVYEIDRKMQGKRKDG